MRIVKSLSKAAAIAVAGTVTSAFGAASLTSVGVLDSNVPFSEVRALTVAADGTVYAVGGSRSATWNANHPFIWSSSGGILELENPSGAASDARGVSLITNTTPNRVAISGSIGGVLRSATVPVTNLTDLTRANNTPGWDAASGVTAGAYNTSRSRASDGRSDAVGYTSSQGFRHRFYPALGTAGYSGSGVRLQSVSEQGVPVGRDTGNPSSRTRAVYGPTVNAAVVPIPGGSATRSEGYGISRSGQWLSGYDDSADLSMRQAFKWQVGDAGMTLLPMFGTDTDNIAYAINNDGIAVGHTWNSTDSYRAVVWDTTGLWDGTGQPKLVQSLLNAAGVNTSMWTNLQRVTTISDDGMTLGGYGIWAADGSTRGWVATIPEPATLSLLVLGALPLMRRRQR